MSTIDARHEAEAAELLARCLRAWRRWGSYTEAARRLGVTSRFLREAVERAEAAGVQVDASPLARVYKPPSADPEIHASPAEERSWLKLIAQGADPATVAQLAGVTVDRIRLGLERARDRGLAWWEARRPWNPRVEIMIPQDYRPSSPCPHDGPIARGRRAYCVVCDKSGLDHEPGMQVDPKTAPKPERATPPPSGPSRPPALEPPAPREAPKVETPKQRKARERAEALERLRWLL